MRKRSVRISILVIICIILGGIMPSGKVVNVYASAGNEGGTVLSVPVTDQEYPEGALHPEGAKSTIDEAETAGASADNRTGKLPSAGDNGYQGYIMTELGGNEYGYNSLTDSEKRLFDAMGDQIELFIHSDAYTEDIDSNSAALELIYDLEPYDELKETDIAKVICRFIYSNPQYYWLGLQYYYALGEETAKAVLYVDPYYYRYETRKAADDAIAGKAQEWVDLVREAAAFGDYYGVLKCHDLIIRSIDYAYDSSGRPEDAMWAHNIAGVFMGQGAVCEGYAKTFEYILDRAGIPNIYIIGTGSKEEHAWNAVEIEGKWYLCDITWDDPNHLSVEGLKDSNYTYFCMPASEFGKKHSAWGKNDYYGYELPEFADTTEFVYFMVFECYSDSVFTEESGETFAAAVLDNRYRDNDFVFAAFPDSARASFADYVAPHLTGLDLDNGCTMTDTPYGTVLKYESPIIENPADSISIETESLEIGISETKTVRAILPAGSDDRVVWSVSMQDENDTSDASRYIKLSARGTEVVLTGRRNGSVILTATVYSSLGSDAPISAGCSVKVGTGGSTAEAVIWQNGTKDSKSVKIATNLTASSWKDSGGRSKSGKLVWFVSDTQTDPVFDETKHGVSFSAPKSKKASVNAKGIVSAKTAGTVYVYVCDTGSLDYEEHVIDIAAGPTKLFLTSIPNSTNKDEVLKKVGINAGLSGKVYITPFIKNGAVDTECTYTAQVAKSDQAKYLDVGNVLSDDDGNAYFIVSALDFDQSKAKTVSVKVNVICDQTGKKASLTVVIGNSVENATLETESGEPEDIVLATKKSSVTLKLKLMTILGTTEVTTDKIRIYVGQTDVSFNERDKVEADKGATIKAKFDKKTMTVTLTATKDAGTRALISAAFTDVLTKDTILIDLADVDEHGTLSIW